jgi:hypothetical protein
MDNTAYDMSQSSEVTPSFFVKKDYLSILDNMNGVYSSNQLVIDTSQLSNSNKWINYREGYLLMPLTISCTTPASVDGFVNTANIDYMVSLKNWYGTMIHSISLDLQGSTIIQQTPFQSLWNCFKLLTTLSYQSLVTEGPTIGFYPDTSTSFSFNATVNTGGIGVCNNSNFFVAPPLTQNIVTTKRDIYNKGFYERQRVWNYSDIQYIGNGSTNATLLGSIINSNLVYKSGIFTKTISTAGPIYGVWQAQIQAVIYLRHLHSFFDKAPLMKGIFFRLTLNLNNTSFTVTTSAAGGAGTQTLSLLSCPLGGVNPLMVASSFTGNGSSNLNGAYKYNISVGATCLDSSITSVATVTQGVNKNVTLNVPAYTFNPIFESAYISNSVRKIQYDDIYQYQVLGVGANGTFNNLITNGIAGLKSCLVIPFLSTASNAGVSPIQSPYDPSGGGTTSPLIMLNNFNVVVSGQNALYNNMRYVYGNFIEQLNGQNAINGNIVDGMGSSLISQQDFENSYCYYYVDVSRCLPIEVGVSKSVNIVGQNMSPKIIDLYVFLSYSCEITIDIILGARV